MAFRPVALLRTFKIIFFVRSLGLLRTRAAYLPMVRPQKSLLRVKLIPIFLISVCSTFGHLMLEKWEPFNKQRCKNPSNPGAGNLAGKI